MTYEKLIQPSKNEIRTISIKLPNFPKKIISVLIINFLKLVLIKFTFQDGILINKKYLFGFF